MFDFDIVVVGGNAQALAAARTARASGAKVAIAEPGAIGAEELQAGRIPISALIKAAGVFNQCRESMEFGIRSDNVRVTWSALKLRIADVQDDIRALWRTQLKEQGIEHLKGTLRIEDTHTAILESKSGERTITASKFIQATAPAPELPQIEGLAQTGYLTIAQLFALPEMPRSLTFLGSNAVAVELAFALARLGCRVTVLCTDATLLPGEDHDISAFAEKLLQQEGVALHTGANIQSATVEGEKKQVTFEANSEVQQAESRHILALAAEVPVENLESRIVLTQPGIAAFGLSEAQARQKWDDVQIYQQRLSQLERCIIEGETRGLVKLVTGDGGRILGAHVAGHNAGELLLPFIIVMQSGSSFAFNTPLTAPPSTMSEAVQCVLVEYAQANSA
jgi:pyruvate/2-oxoglutarate dehydrogenase complex dihydrolipoamide dehydrogenase (E3) component